MVAFRYPATFSKDKHGRILVQFVDLKGITDRKDMADAMREAEDCLGSMLSFLMADKEAIPAPSRAKRGQVLVAVPLWLAPKLALYLAMRERRVNNSQLARKLGVSELVVRRMLDPKHDTKPERIQAALQALGKRVVVSVDEAA